MGRFLARHVGGLLSLLVYWSLHCISASAQVGFVREWQTADGFAAVASLVRYDSANALVVLKVSGNGREVNLSMDRLDATDQNYVKLGAAAEQDKQQFEKVSEHLESLRTTPSASILVLKELAKLYPTSPYASVWGGVASASGQNDVDSAIKQFNESLVRIKKQRDLDPSRHRRTMCSAFNNLAVCYIKERKPDSAARYLLDALELVEATPPVLSHNIRYLMELSNEPNATKMDVKYRQRLIQAFAKNSVEDNKRKLPLGWYYSLDLDIPSGAENELSVTGVDPPDRTLELIASGSGLVCAPGYVVTVSTSVVHPYRSAALATVAIPSSENRWKLKPAQRVFVTQPRKTIVGGSDTVAVSESTTQATAASVSVGSEDSFSGGIAGMNVNSETTTHKTVSNYVLDNPTPGTVEAELAALKVDSLDIKPCVFVDSEPQSNQRIGIVGYNRGPNMLLDGKHRKGAYIINNLENGRFAIGTIVLGGERGAPCVDELFRVRGLAWSSNAAQNSGLCYTTKEIANWFASTVNTADIRFAEPSDRSSYEAQLESAVVPVLVWGYRDEEDMKNPIYRQFYEEENLIDMLIVRDGWCFRCGGDGRAHCQKCNGSGNVVVGSKRVQHGTNPATGEPMYHQEPDRRRCSDCSGRREVDCKYCSGGRLPIIEASE